MIETAAMYPNYNPFLNTIFPANGPMADDGLPVRGRGGVAGLGFVTSALAVFRPVVPTPATSLPLTSRPPNLP
jgi:hypothetical protein